MEFIEIIGNWFFRTCPQTFRRSMNLSSWTRVQQPRKHSVYLESYFRSKWGNLGHVLKKRLKPITYPFLYSKALPHATWNISEVMCTTLMAQTTNAHYHWRKGRMDIKHYVAHTHTERQHENNIHVSKSSLLYKIADFFHCKESVRINPTTNATIMFGNFGTGHNSE